MLGNRRADASSAGSMVLKQGHLRAEFGGALRNFLSFMSWMTSLLGIAQWSALRKPNMRWLGSVFAWVVLHACGDVSFRRRCRFASSAESLVVNRKLEVHR